jgi:hypothetical protein
MNLNPPADKPTTGDDPDWIAEILAENQAIKAAERAAKLLAPSQPYMAANIYCRRWVNSQTLTNT